MLCSLYGFPKCYGKQYTPIWGYLSIPFWGFAMIAQFPEKLESLRGEMTQREFAKRLGIPLTTYTNWVSGIRSPSAEAVLSICSQLGVSADWLLGLTDKAKRNESEERLNGLKKAMRALLDKY